MGNLSSNRLNCLYTLFVFLFVNLFNKYSCQTSTCNSYSDLFVNLNTYAPQFNLFAYTVSPAIRVDETSKNDILTFQLFDGDSQSYDTTQFTVTSSDSNFYVTDDGKNFFLNFKGSLRYNINAAHRYQIKLTATDKGLPPRSTDAIVHVPLKNWNVNAPTYQPPVEINVAIDFVVGDTFAILNAYDVDGDKVTYSMDPSATPIIRNTFKVNSDGSLSLLQSVDNIPSATVTFNVLLADDGSCCGAPPTPVSKIPPMAVKINIIDVNRYSPSFIAFPNGGDNWCTKTYSVKENEIFSIDILAEDKDTRTGGNGDVNIVEPYIDGIVPQNSFKLTVDALTFVTTSKSFNRKGTVKNLETFDYEKPKYGSNTMYLMYRAEDNGKPRRYGYCFLTVKVVDVNDNAPVFSQANYAIYVSKGSLQLIQWTYRFIATDADSGDNGVVKYRFPIGTAASVTSLFSLTDDGVLSIIDKNTFYQNSEYKFQIEAYDMGVPSLASKASVTIIKSTQMLLPPFFKNFPANNQFQTEISEMQVASKLADFELIIQSSAQDQFLRCYLSPKPSPEVFTFRYNNNPGQSLTQLEKCSLSVSGQLSYKVNPTVILFMVAELGSSKEATTARELKILTIKLKEENINAPKFLSSTLDSSCVEGAADVGKVIAVVKAFDADINPPFNTITYEFVDKTNYPQFAINPNTGEITLAQAITNIRTVNLEVLAKDGDKAYGQSEPNSNSIYVSIRVIDINDNPPAFTQASYTFDVNENAQPGSVIGTVHATDVDTDATFTFSISDSTFGIRSVYQSSLANQLANYKGSAEIYINNYLDYLTRKQYNLKIIVSDSTFKAQADVTINIKNVNVRAPQFQPASYIVTGLMEKTIPTPNPFPQLKATDQDTDLAVPTKFTYQIYSTPFIDASWFNLIGANQDQLTLVSTSLNRDAPYGTPIQYLPISVSDSSDANTTLTTYSTVRIELDDKNDNAPIPQFVDIGQRELIINEADVNANTDLYFIDVDDCAKGHGPPFTINFNDNPSMFTLKSITGNPTPCEQRVRYTLGVTQALNRDTKKFYDVPYTAADAKGFSQSGTLRVTVGDIDNNPQSDGAKRVNVIKIEDKLNTNLQLGSLYVKDNDDWDARLQRKTASDCVSSPANLFSVDSQLRIKGPLNLNSKLNDDTTLTCKVTDSTSTVTAKVTFSVDNVEYVDLNEVTFVRVVGVSAEELVFKTDLNVASKLDAIKNTLTSVLSADYVKIVTVRNFEILKSKRYVEQAIVPMSDKTVGSDVYFYAVKANRYISSLKAYALLSTQLARFTGLTVTLVDDVCTAQASGYCPANTKCQQNYVYSQEKLVADGSAAALAGIDGFMNAQCYCDVVIAIPQRCYRGTEVKSGNYYYCDCPSGYDGSRCELLALTFKFNPSSPQHSYALYSPIVLCDYMRIELEFITERARGLILFNGPTNREGLYFVAIEIINGEIVVHIGSNTITMSGTNVADKAWHKLDVSIALNTIQVAIDKCNQKTLAITNLDTLKADVRTTDTSQLSLGGIPPSISSAYYYHSILSVFEYEGCIRNIKVNGRLRDLALTANTKYNLAQENCDCKYLNKQTTNCIVAAPIAAASEFPWWIILIIIAALMLLALILGLAVCTMRRKETQKKFLNMFPDDDIRETIINYADGAGEENTENYNIDGMKIPITKQIITRTAVVGETSLNDQYLIFANEGDGSDAGSLSSINTDVSDHELDFDYLPTYGPKFSRIATILNEQQQHQPQLHNNEYEIHTNRGFDYQGDRNVKFQK